MAGEQNRRKEASMSADRKSRLSRASWLPAAVRSRPQLVVSAAVGSIVTSVLVVSSDSSLAGKLLSGWDAGVGLYLGLVAHMMIRSDVCRIRYPAAVQDEGRLAILVLTVGAALASLGAIFAELAPAAAARGSPQPRGFILAAVTIVLSWAFIHTIFALHYAHEFYDDNTGQGMAFPSGDVEPDYWDFMYFSFVVGMTSQVSDVAITSKHVRRTVTAHGIVSFLFNIALLALTVNLAASAI
jgi:uncharacterized membrane protein